MTSHQTTMKKDAEISGCGTYRYWLTRRWGPDKSSKFMIFIMLNPSTADANIDDPTIRRCIGFAKRESYAGLLVRNLFAYRATNPKELKSAADPVGQFNSHNHHIGVFASFYKLPIVCAWGANPIATKQAKIFLKDCRMIGMDTFCLGVTKKGAPKHPLYLPNDAPLIRYDGVTK